MMHLLNLSSDDMEALVEHREKARQQQQKRHTHQRDGAKKAAPPSIRLASL